MLSQIPAKPREFFGLAYKMVIGSWLTVIESFFSLGNYVPASELHPRIREHLQPIDRTISRGTIPIRCLRLNELNTIIRSADFFYILRDIDVIKYRHHRRTIYLIKGKLGLND